MGRGAQEWQLGNGHSAIIRSLNSSLNVRGGDHPRRAQSLKLHFDRMRNGTDWGFRAVQDDSNSWNGENVFDVYTKSNGTALDGTKYRDWWTSQAKL
jgi:hypothetical protein